MPPLLSVLLLLLAAFLLPSTAANQPARYFVNCGSSVAATVGNRSFSPDTANLQLFSASLTNSKSVSNSASSSIYASARVFTGVCWYSFAVPPNSNLFLRLHFLPFSDLFSSSSLQLTVSDTLLLRSFNTNTQITKEYLLWSRNTNLNLTFQPSPGSSTAFLNALELFTSPTNFLNSTSPTPIPSSATNIPPWGQQAIETIHRINAGGPIILPADDPLWRSWINDQHFLYQQNTATNISTISTINFSTTISGNLSTAEIAPADVYNTLQQINNSTNITWVLPVTAGHRYLVRLHFCDIFSSSSADDLVFNVYINNQTGIANLRPRKLVPFFHDFYTDVSLFKSINISIGHSVTSTNKNAILNGMEVFKVNNTAGSLDGETNPLNTPPNTSGSTNTAVILAATAAVVVVVILVVICVIFVRRKRTPTPASHGPERKGSTSAWTNVPEVSTTTDGAPPLSSFPSQGFDCLHFSLEEMNHATNGFDEKLVIGSGGFGKVYRGVLRDGTAVAVKRASATSRQGFPEFRNEIMVLSQIRHRHLVSLVGYCDDSNQMILVYEYMSKGPLKDLVHGGGGGGGGLTWTERLEICIGAARGLHYLHTGFTQSIIHRDVKSSNILLGENLVAKVADFGLSRLGPSVDETHVSTQVKGSFGYLDPEYFRTQKLTQKSDVFSFGVVLLEVLSGRAGIAPDLPREEVNLAEWAVGKVSQGRVEEVVDSRMKGGFVDLSSVKKFAEVAMRCIHEYGSERPTIGDVLWSLEYSLQLQRANERRADDGGDSTVVVSELLPQLAATRVVLSSTASTAEERDAGASTVFSQIMSNEGR